MPEGKLPGRQTDQLPHPWLVVSDLDGTILDHWTYSPQAMLSVLQELEIRGIPVLFNTSKTAAELLPLRQQLKNRHPFIVENGSAIYVPPHYFSKSTTNAVSQKNLTYTASGDAYSRIALGLSHPVIQQWLNTIRLRLQVNFACFSDLGIAQIVELTGMNPEAAALARQREFSEVIRWQDSDSSRREFCRAAQQAGFRTLQGGRFLHLLGPCDKGQACQRILETYEKHWGRRPGLIACGDGENDIDMLRMADLALLVRSPVHDLPIIDNARGRVLATGEVGPAGLAQMLHPLLQEILTLH